MPAWEWNHCDPWNIKRYWVLVVEKPIESLLEKQFKRQLHIAGCGKSLITILGREEKKEKKRERTTKKLEDCRLKLQLHCHFVSFKVCFRGARKRTVWFGENAKNRDLGKIIRATANVLRSAFSLLQPLLLLQSVKKTECWCKFCTCQSKKSLGWIFFHWNYTVQKKIPRIIFPFSSRKMQK